MMMSDGSYDKVAVCVCGKERSLSVATRVDIGI